MGILANYKYNFTELLYKWNLNLLGVKDIVTILLFFPVTVCFVLFIVSIIAGLISNRLSVGAFLIELPFILLFVLALIFFIYHKYNYVRYFLVAIFYSVSLFCLYSWGMLHYIGIIFAVLLMLLCFFTFTIRHSVWIIGTYFLLVGIIGLLQASNSLDYNYNWSPQVFVFDYLIVLVCIFLVAIILWVYNLVSVNQINKISTLLSRLRDKNKELEKRVLTQTIRLMKNRLKLDRSQAILDKAYGKLTISEKDRFSQMNRLAHTAISVGKRVHNIKSPLMYVMNQLNSSHIDKRFKESLLSSLMEISIEVESIRKDTSNTSYAKIFNVSEVVGQAVQLLHWKFHEKTVVVPKVPTLSYSLYGDQSKFKHVVVNLLDNALEAVSNIEHPHIKLTILKEIDALRISVIDNGEGVGEDNLKKLFKSFFTTRANGCGLGLSISLAYIKHEWNGNIEYSRKEGSSIFSIDIPISNVRN